VVAQLSHKFVRSLPWAMGEAFFNTLYGVSVVVVIGRFIAPVELGAASTAIATVAVIEVVSSAGLQEAVVRSRSADTDVTDTAFIMAMTFAVLGMVVCYLAALGVAAAFGDRRLIALVLVASLLLPFNALAAVPTAILRRKMRAGVLTRRIIAGKILGLFTLSIAGVSGLGSWSLVLANLATSLGSLVTILMAMNRWPRMRFARQEAGELLHFGAMVSAETILSTINTRTFGLLFGYFHGLAALGNFQLAVRLADEVANLIHNTVARFGLSFFAGKERMAADTKSSFLTGTQLIMAVTTPLFTGIALVAYDFTAVAFGSRWEASAPFIQIIAISMVAGFQNILVGPVLRARGQQTILVSYAAFAAGFVMISCIATAQMPAIFGVIGFGSMQFLFEPFMALTIQRHLQISLKMQFTNVIGPLAAAASMAIAVMGFQLSLAGAVPIIRLVGSIMIGMIVYPIALWFLSPAVVAGAKSLLLRYNKGG
jgi:O-antigen/teichoic acid export membrane protein